MSLNKAIEHGKENERNTVEVKLLTALVEITEVVIGAEKIENTKILSEAKRINGWKEARV